MWTWLQNIVNKTVGVKDFWKIQFTKTLSKLSEMLGDNDGYWSSMRYISVVTTTTIILVWAILSFVDGLLQPIPESVLVLFSVAVTGKWLQKKDEVKADHIQDNNINDIGEENGTA